MRTSRRHLLMSLAAATAGAALVACAGAQPTATPAPAAPAPAKPAAPAPTTAPAAAAKPAAAAAPSGSQKSTNVWFNQANQVDNFKKNIVEHYHKSQDNYRLEVILVPNQDLVTKLTAAIAGGDAPDAVRIGGPALNATFYLKGATTAIDTFDPKIQTYDFVPAVKQAVTWKGKVWAMPVNSGAEALYFNKELYTRAGLDPAKPPKTNEEMIDAAKKIRQLGGNIWGQEFMTKPNSGTSNLFHGTQFGFGAQEVSDDGRKVLFDGPEHLELFTWYKTNVIDTGIMPIKLMDETSVTKDFGTGSVGQYIAYPANVEINVQTLGAEKVQTSPLPAGPKGSVSPIGFGTLIIPSKAKNPEGGWDFVSFIGNDAENDSVWCTAFGQLPPRLSFRDSKTFTAYLKQRPLLDAFLAGQKSARVPYFGPAVNQVWVAYAKAVEAVTFGAKTPEQALKDAQTEAQTALDKELAGGAEPLTRG